MDSSFDLDLPPPAPPCSGCFEALSRQFRLSCHHSLCQPCLRHSKTQDKVECPECECITKMADVEEMDQTMNETLDESYLFSQDEADQSYSSMMSNVGYVTTECGGCRVVKMVTVKCLDCNKCMCAECRVLHKQVPQNRCHTVESVEEVIRKVQMDLDDVTPQLEKREEALKLKLYEETRYIDELKNAERKLIDEVNSYREEVKRQVDEHHDQLIHNVHEISELAVMSSNERKDRVDLSIDELTACLTLVNDLTTGVDFSYLLQDGRNTHGSTLAKIKAVDERMNNLKEGTLPSMSVVGPKPWVGNRVGTLLQTDTLQAKDETRKEQRSSFLRNTDNTKSDKPQEEVSISKLQRHQSLDSGRTSLMPPKEHADVQVKSNLQRYESLDSINTRKAPKLEVFNSETNLLKRNVNIQDIMERLQKCAAPKKHDTSPRDLPRRSHSFTTTIKPALNEHKNRVASATVYNKSVAPRRSQSFTQASNKWLVVTPKEQKTEGDSKSLPTKQTSNDTKPSNLQNPVKQTTPEKNAIKHPIYTPKYTPKTTPETNSDPTDQGKKSSENNNHQPSAVAVNSPITLSIPIIHHEQEKKPEVSSRVPKRSLSFTHKYTNNRQDMGRWSANRRLSDPQGSAIRQAREANTWGSTNSISAASEASIKSYSSFSDLSDIDGCVTPRAGLYDPLNPYQINNAEDKTDKTQAAVEINRGNLVNGTSTPVSNMHLRYPDTKEQIETKDDQSEAPILPSSKKITSDQIRNMVNSMVSPRRTGNTASAAGLKSVPLLSPRRLTTGYQTGSRKSPLSTTRSYSTGVIHTITETDQDVESPNVFDTNSKSGRLKPYCRSLSLNTTPGTSMESVNEKCVQKDNNDKEEKDAVEKTRNSINDDNKIGLVDPTLADVSDNIQAPHSSSSGKPKGILKQSKEANNRDSTWTTNPSCPEVRTQNTEELIEKPRHTIHSPRMAQQTKKNHANGPMSNGIVQQQKPQKYTGHSTPKKLSLNIPIGSDTENEDTQTETIKNSPRFMDIFHQLNGEELSEPRRVHVLKLQMKFVEEENQKRKARKAFKSNGRRVVNGSTSNCVHNPGLSKTMPAKLVNSHHYNGGMSAMSNSIPNPSLSKTLPAELQSSPYNVGVSTKGNTNINGSTSSLSNGVSHVTSNSNNCCANDFTNMKEMKYIIAGLSQLPFRPYRVYMINDALWCSALSGLHLYDVNCKFIKSIKHPNLRHCRAIVKTAPNEIVVGCADKYGLVALDLNGEYKSQIITGCFPSVVYHRQQLFALQFDRNEILVFGADKKKASWQGLRIISLNYTYNSSLHDIMSIHDDGTMYMSCWNNNCVLQFSGEGNLLASCGQYGQGEAAGRLYDPRLCKLDFHGNALVADYWNQRMQICTKSGEWSLVNVTGDLGLALDAVIDDQLSAIWVIARDNKLMKFTVVVE